MSPAPEADDDVEEYVTIPVEAFKEFSAELGMADLQRARELLDAYRRPPQRQAYTAGSRL